VVENTSRFAHAGGGDDDGLFSAGIEFFGFSDGAYQLESFEPKGVVF